MSADFPHFERFLRTVHRRLVWLRIAEHVGVCTLVACLAALYLEPILLWRGQSALPICLAALAGGCAAGLVWGMTKRPTRLDAAIEADQQLHWHDLLGSAWLVLCPPRGLSDKFRLPDPWEMTVLAIAEERCRQTGPSTVLLKRWSGRAWSGVGLMALFAIALACVPGRAARSQAAPPNVVFGDNSFTENNLYDAGGLMTDRSPVFTAPQAGQPDERRTVGTDISVETTDNQQATMPERQNPGDLSDKATRSASGGKSSQTSDNSAAPVPLPAKERPASGSDITGGALGMADSVEHSQEAAGNQAGSRASSPPVAPWHSSDWPAARGTALDAVRAGTVPAHYRDLVRDYFDRD